MCNILIPLLSKLIEYSTAAINTYLNKPSDPNYHPTLLFKRGKTPGILIEFSPRIHDEISFNFIHERIRFDLNWKLLETYHVIIDVMILYVLG